MKVTDIQRLATTIRIDTSYPSGGLHESVFRSWQIVAKVKELLEQNTPAPLILELIETMEEGRNEVQFSDLNTHPRSD